MQAVQELYLHYIRMGTRFTHYELISWCWFKNKEILEDLKVTNKRVILQHA